jgi:hypothetical protein
MLSNLLQSRWYKHKPKDIFTEPYERIDISMIKAHNVPSSSRMLPLQLGLLMKMTHKICVYQPKTREYG